MPLLQFTHVDSFFNWKGGGGGVIVSNFHTDLRPLSVEMCDLETPNLPQSIWSTQ